ncbi:MAG: hypothetical protein HQL29_00185 [Candidatus Omnitrophica bacterium]|nr:hypothetical protein [Candidatus Omnitrophota bacterium]
MEKIEQIYEKEDIKNIAKYQKLICWLFLFIIIGYLSSLIPAVGIVLLPLSIIAGIVVIFIVYRLAKALKIKNAWLYAIGMLVPLVKLIVLITVIRDATKVLTAKNIKVGIMGCRKADLAHYLESCLN